MSAAQGLVALTSALVHPSADTPVERARHETRIAQSLVVAFAAFAVAPFFLAFHGAPSPWQTVIFLCGLTHLAVVMLVSRTGRLILGMWIGFGATLCVGLVLFFGIGAGAGCALAWIMLGHVDATQSNDRRTAPFVAMLTFLSLCAILAGTIGIDIAPAGAPVEIAAMSGFALLFTLLVTRNTQVIAGHPPAQSDAADCWIETAEAIGAVVVTFDANGAVSNVSGGCRKTIGAASEDLVAHGLFDRVHVADRPTFLKLVRDAAQADETVVETVRVRVFETEDGPVAANAQRHLWIEMRARRSSRGTDVIAVLRDTTEVREQGLEMETARRAIEAASLSKDQFIANMSHELRTPLNSIIGFSEILGSHTLLPTDPAKQREYARIVNRSGHHLLAVVNSILDMSKLQSGTFSIIAEQFEVAPLIDVCCDMVKLKALAGSVRLVRDCPDTLEPLTGDLRACKQIIINLLSNAVKFTPENGQVTIKARPDGNSLLISVSDTGVGIDPADLVQLGNPFFQAASSLNRPFEGAGLGLSVVRGLVGLHGGTIAIESGPGAGTCVRVRLPLDCRVIDTRGKTTTIETIGRRASMDLPQSPAPRMKHSA